MMDLAGIPLPPLTLNGADTTAAGGHSGNSFEIPFSFDHSGWNVNIKGQGAQDAQGATGQGRSGGSGSTPVQANTSNGIAANTFVIVVGFALLLLLRK